MEEIGMETKEVVLSNGKTLTVRGREYWELLDRPVNTKPSEDQLSNFELCIVDPKLTKDEIKLLLKKPVDGIAVATTIAELEKIQKDFIPENQQMTN